jgi:hypothetical protein
VKKIERTGVKKKAEKAIAMMAATVILRPTLAAVTQAVRTATRLLPMAVSQDQHRKHRERKTNSRYTTRTISITRA